jgi:hypothetical protein
MMRSWFDRNFSKKEDEAKEAEGAGAAAGDGGTTQGQPRSLRYVTDFRAFSWSEKYGSRQNVLLYDVSM